MLPSNANFFAVNPSDVERLTAKILAKVVEPERTVTGRRHILALVDQGFDHTGSRLAVSQPATRLYDCDRWSVLADHGPLLIQLPVHQATTCSEAVEALVRHCSGRPMLSFLKSSFTLDALVDHWRQLIAPEVAGVGPVLLRWADTRVSSYMAQALLPQNWRCFSAPLSGWWTVDRYGDLNPLIDDTEHQSAVLPVVAMPFALSDSEVVELTRLGMPDALVQTLWEQLPELVSQDRPAVLYGTMNEAVSLAEANGIEAYPDIHALAVFLVLSGREAAQRGEVRDLLRSKSWASGKLASELAKLV